MSTLPQPWRGLIDDAAVFPPGDSPLPDAVEAYIARESEWYAGLVGSFVVKDVDVPRIADALVAPVHMALSVVVTGGAGAIAGAARLAAKSPGRLHALETVLNDPDDLPGNTRRVGAAVDAARDEGVLDDDVLVYVELPHVGSTASWLAAADVVAENEFRLKFRTGGLDAAAFPAAHALASWIDAALDRETPFKCTAGLHNAVRHTGDDGFEHHGFLNVLLATRQLFDGVAKGDVVGLLETRDGAALARLAGEEDLTGARRWFTSYGSCSILEPLDDLIHLGLLEAPR